MDVIHFSTTNIHITVLITKSTKKEMKILAEVIYRNFLRIVPSQVNGSFRPFNEIELQEIVHITGGQRYGACERVSVYIKMVSHVKGVIGRFQLK